MPFVSFEGIDGSGKSTQHEALAVWLERQGETVVRTREPGGGSLGDPVGEIFRRPGAPPMSPMEQMLLINAARYDHVRSVIRPALARGEWVLTDRFYDSTYALQVFETDVPEALFDMIRDAVMDGLDPDLTLILDMDPDAAASRRGGRSLTDPLEAHRNFERIRRGYRALAEPHRRRCRLIDASGDEDQVSLRIQEQVSLWRTARSQRPDTL